MPPSRPPKPPPRRPEAMRVMEKRIYDSFAEDRERTAARKRAARFTQLLSDPEWKAAWYAKLMAGRAKFRHPGDNRPYGSPKLRRIARSLLRP